MRDLKSHKKTVLVIEDDAGIREALALYLDMENYHVEAAAGGNEGLKILDSVVPCVIFLDIRMPDMDGWEVLSQIKNHTQDAVAKTPVVMMTAGRGSDFKDLPELKHKNVDLIEKPLNIEALAALLERHCPPDYSADAPLVARA